MSGKSGDSALPSGSEIARPRLLDRVHEAIRRRSYSRRTEKTHWYWIRYFIFHNKGSSWKSVGAFRGKWDPPQREFRSFSASRMVRPLDTSGARSVQRELVDKLIDRSVGSQTGQDVTTILILPSLQYVTRRKGSEQFSHWGDARCATGRSEQSTPPRRPLAAPLLLRGRDEDQNSQPFPNHPARRGRRSL